MTDHDQRHEGTIARVLEALGYAFVRIENDGRDIFLHRTQFCGTWPPPHKSRVRFKLETTSRGLRARDAETIPRIGDQ